MRNFIRNNLENILKNITECYGTLYTLRITKLEHFKKTFLETIDKKKEFCMTIIKLWNRAYLFIIIFVETQKKKLYPNEVFHQDFSRKIYVKLQCAKTSYSQNFLTGTRNFKNWETLRGDERLKLNWRHKRVPTFFKAKSHQALILCSAAIYSAVTLVAEFSVRMQSW